MTQQEIFKYNHLCADFLGFKCSINEQYELPKMMTFPPKKNSNLCYTSKICCIDDMQFHIDWNWIMEVVEAIEKLGYQFDITGNEVGINSNIMSMENISTGGTMNSYNRSYYPTIISICEEEYSKKEAVVEAISQFLIWHNK